MSFNSVKSSPSDINNNIFYTLPEDANCTILSRVAPVPAELIDFKTRDIVFFSWTSKYCCKITDAYLQKNGLKLSSLPRISMFRCAAYSVCKYVEESEQKAASEYSDGVPVELPDFVECPSTLCQYMFIFELISFDETEYLNRMIKNLRHFVRNLSSMLKHASKVNSAELDRQYCYDSSQYIRFSLQGILSLNLKGENRANCEYDLKVELKNDLKEQKSFWAILNIIKELSYYMDYGMLPTVNTLAKALYYNYTVAPENQLILKWKNYVEEVLLEIRKR